MSQVAVGFMLEMLAQEGKPKFPWLKALCTTVKNHCLGREYRASSLWFFSYTFLPPAVDQISLQFLSIQTVAVLQDFLYSSNNLPRFITSRSEFVVYKCAISFLLKFSLTDWFFRAGENVYNLLNILNKIKVFFNCRITT